MVLIKFHVLRSYIIYDTMKKYIICIGIQKCDPISNLNQMCIHNDLCWNTTPRCSHPGNASSHHAPVFKKDAVNYHRHLELLYWNMVCGN